MGQRPGGGIRQRGRAEVKLSLESGQRLSHGVGQRGRVEPDLSRRTGQGPGGAVRKRGQVREVNETLGGQLLGQPDMAGALRQRGELWKRKRSLKFGQGPGSVVRQRGHAEVKTPLMPAESLGGG